MILGQHVGVLAEQLDVEQQQVAEIGGVEGRQPVLVLLVEVARPAVGEIARVGRRHVLGQQPAVLPAIQHAGELPRRPALLVDIGGLEQLLDQPDLVVRVEDGEIGAQVHQFGVAAQDARADRVEGPKPRHAFDAGADELADPLLHLACGLVGESHRQDLGRPGAPSGEDVRDARCQDARLAGSGACEHQQRALGGQDRLALLFIETPQVIGRAPAKLAGDRPGGWPFEALRFGWHAGLTNPVSFSLRI